MVNIWINNVKYKVKSGITIIKACEQVNIKITRFCYSEKLSIAGNCRMCLVEIKNVPKPVVSCVEKVRDGMVIFTNSALAKKSQNSVIESLLLNHPLDCPICDQGGECNLQSVSMLVGSDNSRLYMKNKREIMNKNLGLLVKSEMQRCIQCSRCVRYYNIVTGKNELGMIGRGTNVEISKYIDINVLNNLQGNVIDLCPVGKIWKKWNKK